MYDRRRFVKYSLGGFATISLIPNTMASESFELPNVLILGDSISMGYTPFVRELLEGKANVYRAINQKGNPENCEGTTKGVEQIDRWLSANNWDVIHFNFGLHDIKSVKPSGKNSSDPKDPPQAEIGSYVKNLQIIAKKLQETGAEIIFATTTPFPENPAGPFRDPKDVKKYNKKALEIMKKNNIAINDLYSFVLPRMGELQRPANVHFTKEGSRALAEEVVKSITKISRKE